MKIENLMDKNFRNYTTVNGGRCDVRQRIGYCWLEKHRGYITKQILEEHRCIEKNCNFFQKYEDAQYWQEKEKQRKLRKQRKKEKKEIQKQEQNILCLFREKTKDFDNFAIVGVAKVGKIFEVSFVTLEYRHMQPIVDAIRDETKEKILLREIKTDKSKKRLLINKVTSTAATKY